MSTEQDWSPIEEISGIGATLAAEAAELGYRYTQDLLRRSPVDVAADLEQVGGISFAQVVGSYVPQAELHQLTDINAAQVARLVERGQVSTGRIAWGDPATIAQVAGGDDARPDDLTVAKWQLAAARRIGTAMLTLQIRTEDGLVPPGATVQVARPFTAELEYSPTFAAGPHGAVLIEPIRPGPVSAFVWAPGHVGKLVESYIVAGERRTLLIDLVTGDDSKLVVDEFGNGASLFSPAASQDRELVDRAELSAVEAFKVLSVADDIATLKALQFRQFGIVRFTYATTIPADELPLNAVAGTIIESNDSSWVISEQRTEMAWRLNAARRGGDTDA